MESTLFCGDCFVMRRFSQRARVPSIRKVPRSEVKVREGRLARQSPVQSHPAKKKRVLTTSCHVFSSLFNYASREACKKAAVLCIMRDEGRRSSSLLSQLLHDTEPHSILGTEKRIGGAAGRVGGGARA